MIADKKRREVAQELRKQAAYCDGPLSEWWKRLQDTVTGEVDFADPKATFRAIADLINPACFDTESKDSKSFTCSACGFSESKLVVNPFTLSFSWVKPSYRYCPNCGAEVLDEDSAN